MADFLRILVALRLSALAAWLVGKRQMPVNQENRLLRAALGDITALVPADHPACRVAIKALGEADRA